jgi:hypothetical protein
VLAESWQLRANPLRGTSALSLSLFLAMASARVAASITHLVSVEVIKGLLSTVRMWTSVAVMRIETVINLAMEVVGAVEPRASSDEHAAAEPFGPVVPVWGAVVWGVIVVPIRASRFCSDIDRDLCVRRARNAQQDHSQDSKDKKFKIAHKFLLAAEKSKPRAKVVMTERSP